MKKITFLFCLFLFVLSCKEDEGPTLILPSTLNHTADIDLTQAVCVGQVATITFILQTDPTVGISSFTIAKNGTEILVEETAISSNNFNFAFSYAASSDDFAEGAVSFTATLVDKGQNVVTEMIDLTVVADYAFTVESAAPSPAWDLVNNVAVEDGVDADILLNLETQPCGFGCFKYRMTFTSKNATRFYNIPIDPVVNAFSNRMKQTDVQTIISGVDAVEELVVFSDFPEDITANGAINNFPLVVQIRGTEEYAVIDKLADAGYFIYKKRSEQAGG